MGLYSLGGCRLKTACSEYGVLESGGTSLDSRQLQDEEDGGSGVIEARVKEKKLEKETKVETTR